VACSSNRCTTTRAPAASTNRWHQVLLAVSETSRGPSGFFFPTAPARRRPGRGPRGDISTNRRLQSTSSTIFVSGSQPERVQRRWPATLRWSSSAAHGMAGPKTMVIHGCSIIPRLPRPGLFDGIPSASRLRTTRIVAGSWPQLPRPVEGASANRVVLSAPPMDHIATITRVDPRRGAPSTGSSSRPPLDKGGLSCSGYIRFSKISVATARFQGRFA